MPMTGRECRPAMQLEDVLDDGFAGEASSRVYIAAAEAILLLKRAIVSSDSIIRQMGALMADFCEHLKELTARDFPPPKSPGACEECLKEGTVWVALRECQACGHVGCCDSSTGKHATKHFQETKHPVMRAAPPAGWTWCYLHEQQGMLT
jgi:CPA1 family monovalent cation:H+ antiporter